MPDNKFKELEKKLKDAEKAMDVAERDHDKAKKAADKKNTEYLNFVGQAMQGIKGAKQ